MHRMLITALALLAGIAFAAGAQAQPSSSAFAACLNIDDMTKERLDCFDKLIRPEVIQVLQPVTPKKIEDCRFLREQDARLRCFDRFVEAPAMGPKRRTGP